MEHRIEEYTVGALAQAAGVSVRTLHHYDAIGLLKPAHLAVNGYRLYGREEALRLQEILFYRAAGMNLQDIGKILADSAPLERLKTHRQNLVKTMADQAAIIATLDRTISQLSGDAPMTIDDLYKPFSAEKQAEYQARLIETYGPDMAKAIAKSKTSSPSQTNEKIDSQMQKLQTIEAALVELYESGAAPETADLTTHKNWVTEMWGYECTFETYEGLAELYLSQPDFIARYETLSEGFSQWLNKAMVAYAKQH